MNIQKSFSDAALAVGVVGLGASAIAGTVAVVATGTFPIALIITAVASAALVGVGLAWCRLSNALLQSRSQKPSQPPEQKEIQDTVDQGIKENPWKPSINNRATQEENLAAILKRQDRLSTHTVIHQPLDESVKETNLYNAWTQRDFLQGELTAFKKIIQEEKDAFLLLKHAFKEIPANLAYAKKLAERNAS